MSLDRSRKNGISSWCKECRIISSRNWLSKNTNRTVKRKELTYLQVREYAIKHRYKLSLEDYDAILKQQDYCCAICKRPAKEMTYHLHIDHSHTTGAVRGLLCAPCNIYLGYIKDRDFILQNAIEYLRK